MVVSKQKGVFKRVRNLIAVFDLYGSPVSLSIGGKGESKSILGAIVTLASVIFTFVSTSEVFDNVINIKNPVVTLDSEFNTKSIMNISSAEQSEQSKLFLAFSFFTPNGADKRFSNETNNFTLVKTLKSFESNCLGGVNDCSNATFQLVDCPSGYFDNINTLKGMSAKGAENVTDIFKIHSKCFPTFAKYNLHDSNEKVPDFTASMILSIKDTYGVDQSTRRRLLGIVFTLSD